MSAPQTCVNIVTNREIYCRKEVAAYLSIGGCIWREGIGAKYQTASIEMQRDDGPPGQRRPGGRDEKGRWTARGTVARPRRSRRDGMMDRQSNGGRIKEKRDDVCKLSIPNNI